MSLMNEIVNDSLPIWQQCLESRFVQGLADGTLDKAAFKGYIVEDTLYLKAYARVFALAMYRAKTLADIRAYYSILRFVQEGEDPVRAGYLAGWGLKEDLVDALPPRPENAAYCDFMLSAAQQGGDAELLMAVLPCMFSYYWLAEKLLAGPCGGPDNPYRPLLESYAAPAYRDSCIAWGKFAEEKCRALPAGQRPRLFEIFRQSSRHELCFWQMSLRPRTDV